MLGAPYDQLYLHRYMLRDEIRDAAFKEALDSCVTSDSVVLDVGAGTGILSLFAARAGARKVYAIEPAKIADMAERLIAKNGMQNRIKLIRDRIENVNLPEKADVLVFEWLGAYGNDENMYHLLLRARDRWLKPGGVIIPGNVVTWMAPAHDVDMSAEREFFLGRPFGVALGPIWDLTADEIYYGRHEVKSDSLVAVAKQLWSHDVYADTYEMAVAKYEAAVSFDVTAPGVFNCLATWFSADMPGRPVLTNSPTAPSTHWGRVVFPCRESYDVETGNRIEVKFTAEPGGEGWCRGGWSIRVETADWEHHLDHAAADAAGSPNPRKLQTAD